MRGDKLKENLEKKLSIITQSKDLLSLATRIIIYFIRLVLAILILSTRFITNHRLDIAGGKVLDQINTIKRFLPVRAIRAMISNRCLEYAGYLAYLNIFGLFPLVITIISIFSIVGQTESGTLIISNVIGLLPNSSRDYIREQISIITQGPPKGLLSFAFIAALWTVTSTLEGLRNMFNRMYKVENPPFFLIRRLASTIRFLCAICIMLLTVFMFILFPKLVTYLSLFFGVNLPNLDYGYINIFLTFFVVLLVVTAIYHTLINTTVTMRSVVPGAVLTVSFWFVLGGKVFEYIYDSHKLNMIYGSIANLVLVLAFFYVMNLVLLYGMQFNYLLSLETDLNPMSLLKERDKKDKKGG